MPLSLKHIRICLIEFHLTKNNVKEIRRANPRMDNPKKAIYTTQKTIKFTRKTSIVQMVFCLLFNKFVSLHNFFRPDPMSNFDSYFRCICIHSLM